MTAHTHASSPEVSGDTATEKRFSELLASLDRTYRETALGLFARMVEDLSAVPAAKARQEFDKLLDPTLTDAERFAHFAELSYRYRQRQPSIAESLRLSDLRATQKIDQMMEATGGSLDLQGVRELLGGVSRQAVEGRIKRGTILWVNLAGERRFPAAQFDRSEQRVYRPVQAILEQLAEHRPVDRVVFLLAPKPALDGARPIELLQRGERVQEIKRQAALYLSDDAAAL